MVRAAGKPLAGELRMGVIPTIAPFLLPTLLPRLREQWPDLKLYLREETSQAACDALHRGQLDCVLLALPYACGDVDEAELFEDRLMVAFPPGTADALPDAVPAVGDRRGQAAAARGRPLPQGPCPVRLQPARAARRGGDPRHLAAHPGADGRQWPGHDPGPGNGASRPESSTAPASSPVRSTPSIRPGGSPWSGARAARGRRNSGCWPMRSKRPARLSGRWPSRLRDDLTRS